MACLISKRGKYYRKIKLDLWGYYAMYNEDRISENRRVDHTILDWARTKGLRWKYTKYMRGKYVFRLWNRPRFLKIKRLKPNYIRPRYLRNFYMVLKKKTYIKYIRIAMKGKLVRGFISTYLGYLEARLFIIIYRFKFTKKDFILINNYNQDLYEDSMDAIVHVLLNN